MTEGPIGGAGFGNEFGRPNILGIFRTFEEECAGRYRGYHKPIMVAGGFGLIDGVSDPRELIGAQFDAGLGSDVDASPGEQFSAGLSGEQIREALTLHGARSRLSGAAFDAGRQDR